MTTEKENTARWVDGAERGSSEAAAPRTGARAVLHALVGGLLVSTAAVAFTGWTGDSVIGVGDVRAQTVLPLQGQPAPRRDWQVNHTLIAAGTKLGMRSLAFQPLRAPRSATNPYANPLNPSQALSSAQVSTGTLPYAAAPGLYRQEQAAPSPAVQIVPADGPYSRRDPQFVGRQQDISPDPWMQFPPTAEDVARRDERYRTEPLINEIRLGFLRHDAAVFGSRKEDGFDISLEVLFRSPGLLDILGAPRPHVAGVINTAGETNQLYFGFAWQWEDVLLENLFMGFSLGFSLHDGKLTRFDPGEIDQGKEFGHRLLFREAIEIGYAFDDHHRLSLMVDHVSNANIANNNEGLDSLGLRYGYKF